MSARATPMGYRPSLDGVRALAVASVVGWHYFGRPGSGWLGVDLFFVLSGFLITRLLVEERQGKGRVDLIRFYRRRALRLVPALYLFLIVLTVLVGARAAGIHVVGPARQVLPDVAYGAAYVSNVATQFSHVHGLDTNHLWSLAVEEQYYVLWPLVLLALVRARIAYAAAFTLAFVVVFDAIRDVLRPAHPGFLDFGYLFQYDAILLGCAFGLASFAIRERRAGTLLEHPLTSGAALVVIGVTIERADGDLVYGWRTPVFLVASAVLVYGCAWSDGPVTRVFALPPLVAIGRVSYGIYIWHLPVRLWIDREVGSSNADRVVALAVCAAIVVLSYRFVELPFLRRKWRLAQTDSHDVPLARAVALPDS